MHVSLDGFVAGPNGEMDWIKVNEEIFDHIAARIGKCNAALYGRKTYEMMESYWPTAANKPNASKHDIEHAAWYNNVHKIVLSNTMQNLALPKTTVISNNLTQAVNKIKQQSDNEIAIFGSPAATHALMQHNLIDGYWLFINPIILGQGIPLFKNIQQKTQLTLLGTKQFSCGVTELDYVVNNP
jgi:dihydrofolate reductase